MVDCGSYEYDAWLVIPYLEKLESPSIHLNRLWTAKNRWEEGTKMVVP